MKMKKVIAGLMAFTMLCGSAYADNGIVCNIANTVSVSAKELTLENGLKYYEKSGTTITITGCDESATKVEIPAEIDGLPVTKIENSAFKDCTSLTEIIIPNSVTSIGFLHFLTANH